MKKQAFLIIYLLLVGFVCPRVFAQTLYVDGSFTGTSDGTAAAPYKTIGDAIAARQIAGISNMTSDEEIIVKGGVYVPSSSVESGYITSTSGGYGNYWLTLKAADGETVIIDGANLFGVKFSAMLTLTSGATNVRVQGFTYRNHKNNAALSADGVNDVKFGIQIANYVTNIEITDNEIYDFSWTPSADPMKDRTSFTSVEIAALKTATGSDNCGAISVVGSDLTPITGLVIKNNYIHHVIPGYTEGIAVNGNIDGFEISDNTITEVQNFGIVAAGHYAWVEGLGTVTSALNYARNGVISGNKVSSCRSPIAAAAGIYCDGSSNVIVENNEVSDGQVGFSIGNENIDSNSGSHIVRNNISYDNAWAGFIVGVPAEAEDSYVDDVQVTGNTSFRNGGVIDTYLGVIGQSEMIINRNVQNLSIKNNILYSPNHANLVTVSSAFSVGYEDYYDTISLNYNTYFTDIAGDFSGIFDFSQAGLGWYGNFAYYQVASTLGNDQNSQFSDPQFSDITATIPDLSLQSTSLAIDAGNPAYTIATRETDFLGNARIANTLTDAGAYEYGNGSTIGCTPSVLTPYVNMVIPIDFWKESTVVNVSEGYSNIWLKVETPNPGTVSWTGPNNSSVSLSNNIVLLNSLSQEDSGDYTATFTNDCGAQSTQVITVNVVQNCSLSDLETYWGTDTGENEGLAVTATVGEYVYLSPETDITTGTWSWAGPNGAIDTNGSKDLEFIPLSTSDVGDYTVTYVLGDCTETATYTLAIESIGNPIVTLRKSNTMNFGIDGNRGGANKQNIYLWKYNSNNVNQQWEEVDRGNGYYSYKKVSTNHCIDGNRGGANGQNVYLWSCSDTNQNQHWKKVSNANGTYSLVKRNASGFSLDGNNGGGNRQNIYLWSTNANNPNQQWVITTIGTSDKSAVSNDFKENYNITGFNMYTTPDMNLLNITFDNYQDFRELRVVDITGKTMITELLISEDVVILDTSILSTGVYILQAYQTDGEKISQLFAK